MNLGKPFAGSAVDDDRPRYQVILRSLVLALPLWLAQVPVAQAQLSVDIGIEVPGIRIGINLPTFPDLRRVPGYPVYYAADAVGNYFYYDGLYWVFQGDDWYASSWYNGPWRRVTPLYVPAYVLRVPVYYYRQPPPHFKHWRVDSPPRWDQHWGRDWQQRRPGWNQWDRHAAPAPAPLPTYQRRYPQSRYPLEQDRQQKIRSENFDYRPREPVSRQAYQWSDRSPPQRQGRPQQRAEPWPASAQPPRAQPSAQHPPQTHAQPSREQDRPRVTQPAHAARPQAMPQERGHYQGRADPSNPKQYTKADDPRSGHSPQQQQFGPVQWTEPRPGSTQAPRVSPSTPPRGQPNAQPSAPQHDRPQGAQSSSAARQRAAPQDRGRPEGRAQTLDRRPDKA